MKEKKPILFKYVELFYGARAELAIYIKHDVNLIEPRYARGIRYRIADVLIGRPVGVDL